MKKSWLTSLEKLVFGSANELKKRDIYLVQGKQAHEHMQFLTSRETKIIGLIQFLGVPQGENSVHVPTKSTNEYRDVKNDNSGGCF